MHALKAQWGRLGSSKGGAGAGSQGDETLHAPVSQGGRTERLVIAHFMLGNTYLYQDEDWLDTFDLVRATSLDGLSLNLGPEEWQLSQAIRAYSLLSKQQQAPQQNPRPIGGDDKEKRRLKLFLSLDMNVLPPNPKVLAETAVKIIQSGLEAQLLWEGKIVLSTFGGHLLGDGWDNVKRLIRRELGKEVFLWPAFFMPPRDFIDLPYVDGTFAWNNAWPMGNHSTNLDEDQMFLQSNKPYMAPVSPLFFTHYGTEGDWAFNKNWIYRSDDLLFPTRLLELLSLPRHEASSIIQVISWNDYGESHYVSPVRANDAQPGSESWTSGMDHVGFRWMAGYFARRWRDGSGLVEAAFTPDDQSTYGLELGGEEARVVLWYRPQVGLEAQDKVGPPKNAEWARNLINVLVIISPTSSPASSYTLQVQNGLQRHTLPMEQGKMNLLTLPSGVGEVQFKLLRGGEVVVSDHGREITDGKGEKWNYNFWSRVWAA